MDRAPRHLGLTAIEQSRQAASLACDLPKRQRPRLALERRTEYVLSHETLKRVLEGLRKW